MVNVVFYVSKFVSTLFVSSVCVGLNFKHISIFSLLLGSISSFEERGQFPC